MPAPKTHHGYLDSRDVVADFFPALEQAIDTSWAPRLAIRIPSDRETETYKWPSQAPGLREWKGGRHEQTLGKYEMTIRNKPYEDTLPMPLSDLRRDKTGFLRRRIAEMAGKAAMHWEVLASSVISTNGNAYDGKSFFATTHDESGSNQSNDLSFTVADPANPTADEMADILVEIIGHFYTLKDDRGDPINGSLRTFMVMVNNAKYWAAAQHAISADRLSSGQTNRVQNLGVNLQTVLNPRLGSSHDAQVHVFAEDGILKPLVFQEEEPLTTQLLGAGSDYEFDNDAHKFGLKATRAAGYGRWQQAIRGTLS